MHIKRQHPEVIPDLKAAKALLKKTTKAKPMQSVKVKRNNMDKTPELTAEDKARLETWRKLWATKVTEPEVIPNWQEVHDICEESYAALPPNYGFFHLICSPEIFTSLLHICDLRSRTTIEKLYI